METPKVAESTGYSRKNPFPAALLENRLLTGAGSTKEVRHFSVDVTGSGFTYEAGDALGIFPENDPSLIKLLLSRLGATGEESVPTPGGETTSLQEALLRHYELQHLSSSFIKSFAEAFQIEDLLNLLSTEKKPDLEIYLWGRDPLDLLEEYPHHHPTPLQFVRSLKRLTPRLYSLASSPKVFPQEIHLTVAIIRYTHKNRHRKGLCSGFLADGVPPGSPVSSFLQISHGFRLPKDPSAPMIMIGPGTGIAPFRAFLQERRAEGARGKNWLFFGNPNAKTDFTYQEEIENFQKEGYLHHLDTAFSRDQPEKIYVQHRIKEKAPELWNWLQEGAHIYICGDARRMAKDVEKALLEIISSHGHLSPEDAKNFLSTLKDQKRYQKDVY